MPWVVGIDEAGYGPNLGPLVQAAVALHLPDADAAGWDTLRPAVRRAHEKPDQRLLIDDSKRVYARGGLEALERGVWSVVAADPHTVHDFLWGGGDVPLWGEDLLAEAWFDGTDSLPLHVDPGAEWEAVPEGWVVAEREGADESRYRVEGLPRAVTITFRPRADGDSAAVALASMLCKYLREVCMRQFNRFWAGHVPGLAPTAGYPVDAKRFYAQIQPAMARLGLTPDQVWRKK